MRNNEKEYMHERVNLIKNEKIVIQRSIFNERIALIKHIIFYSYLSIHSGSYTEISSNCQTLKYIAMLKKKRQT